MDRIKHLDDAQAKELLLHYAQAERNPRGALQALLHADSISFGPGILHEIDEIAPVRLLVYFSRTFAYLTVTSQAAKITPRGSVSRGSTSAKSSENLSGSAVKKDKKDDRERKDSKKEIKKP